MFLSFRTSKFASQSISKQDSDPTFPSASCVLRDLELYVVFTSNIFDVDILISRSLCKEGS